MLDIVASYRSIQFQEKIMIQTQENGKKPHFGLDLGSLNLNLSLQFFFKNKPLSVSRYYGQLSSCAISEKIYDAILRKFSDEWTD